MKIETTLVLGLVAARLAFARFDDVAAVIVGLGIGLCVVLAVMRRGAR